MEDYRLEQVKNIALKAGSLANKYFNQLEILKITTKTNLQDLVSQADKEVEDLIKTCLAKLFPDDGFFGEEGGVKEGKNNSYWLIDPIDGTANFVRGLAYYCVSIAYVKDDKLKIGVIYDPELKEMFYALEGGGAYMNGKKIIVSNLGFKSSIIALGRSHRSQLKPYVNLVSIILQQGAEYRRLGAGALCLAHMATGRLEAYYEEHMYPWDATAGLLIAKEAGAKVKTYMNYKWQDGGEVYVATPSVDLDFKNCLERSWQT